MGEEVGGGSRASELPADLQAEIKAALAAEGQEVEGTKDGEQRGGRREGGGGVGVEALPSPSQVKATVLWHAWGLTSDTHVWLPGGPGGSGRAATDNEAGTGEGVRTEGSC